MAKIIYLILLIQLTASIKLNAQTINPPTNLEAESEDSLFIKVTWDDNSSNEKGFYIERSQTNDSSYWEIIDAVSANVVIYLDYWVSRGIKYYYRVNAFNGSMVSAYSNIDSAVLLGNPYVIPATPSNLAVQNVTQTSITVNWQDNSANENGFIIARKHETDLFYHYIDTVAQDILTYQDLDLTPNHVYLYKVCSFNSFGISDYSNVVSARTEATISIINNNEIPERYFLGNNYPNPFNPTTIIKFGIRSSSFVSLKVYNLIGAEIEKLVGRDLSSGTYQVKWYAANYPAGVYFYRIESGGFSEVKKMILVK